MKTPKPSRDAQLARIVEKIGDRMTRKQTGFLRGWLKRNLTRWKRVVYRGHPFHRQDWEAA